MHDRFLRLSSVFLASLGALALGLLLAIELTRAEPDPTQIPLPPTPTPIPRGLLGEKPVPPGKATDCPAAWSFLDNDQLHYTICLPPGWGLHNGATSGPLAISGLQPAERRSITGFSPEWFPYPVGVKDEAIPAEVTARMANADRLGIRIAEPWVSFGGCSPNIPVVVGGLAGLFCEDSYDITKLGEAVYTAQGQLHAIRVLLPLFNVVSDAGQDTRGYRLYLKLVTPSKRYAERHDALWQLINTVRVYQ